MEVGEHGLKLGNVLLAVMEVQQRGSGNVTIQRRDREENIVSVQVVSLPNAAKYLAQVYKTADSNQLILVNNLVDVFYIWCTIANIYILTL